MAILDLTLCGNPQLESQPWCKYNVFVHLTRESLHSLVLVCVCVHFMCILLQLCELTVGQHGIEESLLPVTKY